MHNLELAAEVRQHQQQDDCDDDFPIECMPKLIELMAKLQATPPSMAGMPSDWPVEFVLKLPETPPNEFMPKLPATPPWMACTPID